MAMQLDVARIREPQLRIERTEDPSAFPAENDYRIAAPVQLELDVRKDKDKLRLRGRVRTTVHVECSRCLEPLPVAVDGQFDLLYLPETAAPEGQEQELADEDVDTAYYRDGIIDLAELVREQLYLALPMKPLCREDCRGLCPVCGTNLNTGSCTCDTAWKDPRLAPLAALARNNDDA
jgi:uncharacterized protein